MTQPLLNSLVGDRFVLESIAGAGGMGTVYRALDQQTGDAVAVKLLHDVPHGDAAERFTREATVLAGLDHPGIVRYVAHGVTDENAPYLAMEWLEGEDLAKRLDRGPMNFSEALTLARGIADALGFAHEHGVVHRDIKPSNVFLRAGWVSDVALLDFGIAHMIASSSPLTATGDFIGTPAYVAPEQARGATTVGPAVDVFSLGCILHECITGSPAFGGGNIVAILAKILLTTPPRIRELRRNVPDSIDMLLSRMLERDPAVRLPNGRVVLEALEAIEPMSLDAYERAPVVSSRRFGAVDLERQLICVLIASLAKAEDSTIESKQMVHLSDLIDEMRKFGAWAETLADGTIVATFAPTRGAATDQATIAARAALLLKARWPEATVVLCTGRGQVQGTLPTGDVLDRAAAMLRYHRNKVVYVVLDDVTRRLLGARFRVDDTTPGTYVLTGENATLDPTRPLLGKPTPCVGRESELSMLDLALTDAIDDASPHAVLVIAAPGTGKSRLRHEFIRRVENRESPPLVLLGRGDPMTVGSAYGIIGEAIRRYAGIVDGEELAVRRTKLAERVGKHVQTDVPRVTAFLGEMCGIPFYNNDPKLHAARQDPIAMADQVVTAFLDFLRAECKANPIVLVLEDLHWGDDLTVKVIEAALRELTDSPLLVLAMARPEVSDIFPKLWQNRVQTVTLRSLSRKAGERLVRQVLGSSISDETVASIVEQSEGNALFLEELIRNVAEGHGDEAPATVLAMLQARIGRLELHVRKILRCASIFGESSWYGGILSLFGTTIHSVTFEDALRSLVRAEILELRRESRIPGEQEYRFRHGLMRDAAYGLLADEDRVAGHLQAAEYLETTPEQDSLAIAEHFVKGQEPSRAIAHLLRGAVQSCDNGDMNAALHIAERALVLEPDPISRGTLLAVKTRVCVWREQYVEVLKCGHEALALVELGGYRWCQLVQQMMPAAAFTGQIETFFKLATLLVQTDPPADASCPYVAAASWVSITSGIMGKRDICDLFLGRAKEVVKYCQPNDHVAFGYLACARANHHHVIQELPWSRTNANREGCVESKLTGIAREECLANVLYGKALMDLGAIEEAETTLRNNLTLAKQINERMSLAYTQAHLARLIARYGPEGALDEATRLAQELIDTNNQSILGFGYGVLAEVAKRRYDYVVAEAEARKAVAAMARFPTYSWDLVALLANILREIRKPYDAVAVSQEGLKKLEQLRVNGFGELHLRLSVAESLYSAGSVDDALSSLTTALYQLRLRVDDIPDPAARQRYIKAVPTHVRLLKLGQDWFPSVNVAARIGLEP
jgi:serine/threonine protein kinase/tetratricopeptide (TPR) repeat protein